MILAVVGANGRSGRVFVEAALARGHQVRAGVYGVHSFQARDGLDVMACDATNPADVAQLIRHTDAVVSLIGHVRHSPADVQTRAITTILEAMRQTGLTRLVSLTGTGVRFPGDKITLLDAVLNSAVRLIDPDRIRDGIEHAAVLQRSQVNWTLVRVLKLTDGAAQAYGLHSDGPARLMTSRATVAAAICEVLENNSFCREAPIITFTQ